ncbi:LPS export ABC transporter periplasmic protein LptC [Muribaculum intestinale]|uniref:LPS export ABC transporter periplasmic protein LptC n=2 Tax=Muribaculum intestinale TaxID=1796646 RepID=UPI0025A9FEB6|nr:LPS export ABC transporter periplasmic protein LptC [Muribaculum intestinale]
MTSRAMRALPGIVCVMILAGAAGACKDEKTEVVSLNVVGDSVPTMTTHTVTTLISDSGQIRYRVTTDNWLVYDEAQVPMWRFPDGLYLEKFDKDFGIEATVQCDSATYFSQRGLWRLDGNVNILNTVGEKFLSQQVFWDQRLNKVYSDSFIHIERADRTIEGYGFESNDKMTNYRITNPTGIFPASDFNPGKESGAADALSADSVAETKAPDRLPPPNRPSKPVLPSRPPERRP